MKDFDAFARSPLNPKAVCLFDLCRGLELVEFNRHTGRQTPFTVLGAPFGRTDESGEKVWCVELRTDAGDRRIVRLDNLGITAYETGLWDRSVCTVRATDAVTLPARVEDDGEATPGLTFLHPPKDDSQPLFATASRGDGFEG